MLTFLLRKSQITEPAPEDHFDNAVGLLFPDNVRTFHGDPGSDMVYASKRFGDLKLRLSEPSTQDEHVLFAHHIWNSGIQMAEFISKASDPTNDTPDERWKLGGERVLELGAGTGIVGITAGLAGAGETVLSDYPSQKILATLRFNVDKNVPQNTLKSVKVQGHEWGILSDNFSKSHANHFTRILCADCLWMDGEHYGLAQSILNFLSSEDHARAWVIAGFHTGRPKLVAFFDIAGQVGLEIDEIWERDADGNDREWARERDDKEKNRWMVVAILKKKANAEVSDKDRQQRYFASLLMQKSNRHP